MKKQTILAGIFALSAGLTSAQAVTVDGQESYDLLFRNGTLDQIDRTETLVYAREVVNALNPEAQERDTGKIELTLREDESGMAQITFRQGDKHRGLGVFPASVGNPMIMYFYETAGRDMAEATGGSPYYVRNRVKDALINPAQMETGQAVINGQTVETTTINLRPFEGDPNQDRMQGFGDLVLSVTMSEEVPGWYVSLIAEAKGDGEPVYRSMVVFDGIEAAK